MKFHLQSKPISLIIGLFFIFFINSLAYSQTITLEEIWSGRFLPKSISGITSMKSGKHYTVLTQQGIEKHSYENFQKMEDLVQGRFTDYQFSPDEKYLLLEMEAAPVYRHSKLGVYQLYDIKNKHYFKINNNQPIQEPLFSPDGSKIAFVFDNNLYYQEIPSLKITQVTTDGIKNQIINGISDWVYEEELGFVRNFEWSPDGKTLAFVRFDESKVKEVDLPMYGKNLYPQHLIFKYPKAGEENSLVTLHSYHLESGETSAIDLSTVEKYYIVKIRFAPDGSLITLTSNRLQNKVDVSRINVIDGSIKKLLSETSRTWIETDNIFLYLLSNGNFVMNSEKNGFNHLYLYDKNGKQLNQITKGNWEVTEVYGLDEHKQKIYFQSTEKGSTNKVIGTSEITTGKHHLITQENGVHNAEFSSDYSYFIDKFSTANTPPVYTLRDQNGKILKTLEDNSSLLSYIIKKEIRLQEFFTLPNGKGEPLNAYIIKPKNFDPQKKYPVLMYVYGGPGHQTVTNSWDSFNYWWFQMLAQQGYIVVSVDGKGTGGKGEAFKKATYKQLGKLELEDQLAAAQWLKAQTYIDENRVGIWGWSFGGYLTSLCMTKGNGTFKMGIAVAPVTNWRFYDTIYTERFLQTPQENSKGYDENSPINYAKELKGNYLIIHGTADDNVHLQNSVEMIEALVQEGKQFDMAIYPDKNHGIYGGKTRYQLYQKMTNYIKTNL
ncbi:S9 family peptidase [Apibacter sp. HY039]|uniref:S9 family peptidase n=1 Tax=Apibacter sp. HY039 TaxID=2501476 RepID=UPI000FEC16C4|nr:S9 family peptidase [Apibacter sp. HY039]